MMPSLLNNLPSVLFATLTALCLSLLLGKPFISWQQKRQFGQAIREEGPQSHQAKSGTPTMGGLVIAMATLLSVMIWGDWDASLTWIAMFNFMATTAIGGLDDFLIIWKKHNAGISRRMKMALLLIVAVLTVGSAHFLYTPSPSSTLVPFAGITLGLGTWLLFPIQVIAITGTANATNLTDGLDGLVTGPLLALIFAMSCSLMLISESHALPVDTLIILGSLAGALLGFLWYNAHPAEVFMGDVGSLSCGSLLATLAIMHHLELWLIIAGGVFVIEALSVMIQITYFKRTGGQRVFRMAPIHHHFELGGLAETKVVLRAWIIAFIFAFLAIMSVL